MEGRGSRLGLDSNSGEFTVEVRMLGLIPTVGYPQWRCEGINLDSNSGEATVGVWRLSMDFNSGESIVGLEGLV